MSKQQRLFLSPPHMSGNEQKYIQEAFDLNWIAPVGNNVNAFENELAIYNNITDVVVVNSGTAAIHLALRLLNVNSDDTVFVSSLTFIASANPILYEKATPIFIDSELETWNMSPEALERALQDAQEKDMLPKAIIVVHLYGQSAKMDEIIDISQKYNVPIIEDAAESLGSVYKGKKSGTCGDYGIFSFNGNKIITTSGGGALVSNNSKAIQKAQFYSTQARDNAMYYQHSKVGYNYRMSNITAGIGRGQLEVINQRIEQRRKIFEKYKSDLEDIPGIEFQPELNNTKSNRWLTALTIDSKITGVNNIEVINKLEEHNIEARLVWKPMHLQPLFKDSFYYPHRENNSISDELFKNGICLPSGSSMSIKQQEFVIDLVIQALGNN